MKNEDALGDGRETHRNETLCLAFGQRRAGEVPSHGTRENKESNKYAPLWAFSPLEGRGPVWPLALRDARGGRAVARGWGGFPIPLFEARACKHAQNGTPISNGAPPAVPARSSRPDRHTIGSSSQIPLWTGGARLTRRQTHKFTCLLSREKKGLDAFRKISYYFIRNEI